MIKKIIMLIAALLLFALPLSGCNCEGGGGKFAVTPQEEYARVYSLAGPGLSYDFNEQPTFSVEAAGTFSGGNLAQSINMSSLYTHDYTKKPAQIKTYSYSKSVNTVYLTDGAVEAAFDEREYGFQYSPLTGDSRYLTSYRPAGGNWETPSSFGNGNYDDLFLSAAFSGSADRLVRTGSRLFDPEKLTGFEGGSTGGYYVLKADVKAENIKDFAEWLNDFYPLFYLKSDTSGQAEWKFFDLDKEGAEYAGRIELKTSPRTVEEVIVEFSTHGRELGGFDAFTFSARTAFESGGVSVKTLSALAE